jgi:hypothetical protein
MAEKKPFFFVHQEFGINLFSISVIARGFASTYLKENTGVNFEGGLLEIIKGELRWSVLKDNWMDGVDATFKKLKADKKFPDFVAKGHFETGEKTFALVEKAQAEDLSQISNEELNQYLVQLYKLGNNICS